MIDKKLTDKIWIYARQFREAIVRTDETLLPAALKCFPHGACGDSSWLLGRYLREKGIMDVEYVCGRKIYLENDEYKHHSHAWLEISGVIIDITADQFDDVKDEVVITTNNLWHKQFENESRRSANYNVFDSDTKRMLDKAYTVIRENVQD